MDKDEEAGLRAFTITVGSYAGTSSPERPEWVERNGVRRRVAAIVSQWREEERLGFRVRLDDGVHMLIYYVPELDIWSGTEQR